MKPNPVVWFEIYVQDMPRAQAFYEAVFRGKLESLQPPDADTSTMQMLAFPMEMNGPGSGGALVRTDRAPSGGAGTIIYFSCDDCAVEESRVAQAGGSVTEPKMSIGPYGFISLVTDTEGNTIGLHSMA